MSRLSATCPSSWARTLLNSPALWICVVSMETLNVLDPSGWKVVVVEAMFLFCSRTRRFDDFGDSGGSNQSAGLFCEPSALKSVKSVDFIFSLEPPEFHVLCSFGLLFWAQWIAVLLLPWLDRYQAIRLAFQFDSLLHSRKRENETK